MVEGIFRTEKILKTEIHIEQRNPNDFEMPGTKIFSKRKKKLSQLKSTQSSELKKTLKTIPSQGVVR